MGHCLGFRFQQMRVFQVVLLNWMFHMLSLTLVVRRWNPHRSLIRGTVPLSINRCLPLNYRTKWTFPGGPGTLNLRLKSVALSSWGWESLGALARDGTTSPGRILSPLCLPISPQGIGNLGGFLYLLWDVGWAQLPTLRLM